ncbi:hypothetical protein QQS21_006779 [Conoideocrella luteorostrata]|uniref:Uncharacterized protein n=1 Tax=Conoideocrella luteorostrata TaxID=1105319 RepID=A0AAJ0CPP7_9HYPO|nr:hypothetical protein QQS21_006779 [Conoideocrella luteorostrata]
MNVYIYMSMDASELTQSQIDLTNALSEMYPGLEPRHEAVTDHHRGQRHTQDQGRGHGRAQADYRGHLQDSALSYSLLSPPPCDSTLTRPPTLLSLRMAQYLHVSMNTSLHGCENSKIFKNSHKTILKCSDDELFETRHGHMGIENYNRLNLHQPGSEPVAKVQRVDVWWNNQKRERWTEMTGTARGLVTLLYADGSSCNSEYMDVAINNKLSMLMHVANYKDTTPYQILDSDEILNIARERPGPTLSPYICTILFEHMPQIVFLYSYSIIRGGGDI